MVALFTHLYFTNLHIVQAVYLGQPRSDKWGSAILYSGVAAICHVTRRKPSQTVVHYHFWAGTARV